jgi:hypothetical protein
VSLVNLDSREFVPVHNTVGGTVTDATKFSFQQSGENITADYAGGDIETGHIVGKFVNEDTAELIYHCLTKDGEMKAGQAQAHFSISDTGKLTIDMQWQWLNGDKSAGTSHYEEITD